MNDITQRSGLDVWQQILISYEKTGPLIVLKAVYRAPIRLLVLAAGVLAPLGYLIIMLMLYPNNTLCVTVLGLVIAAAVVFVSLFFHERWVRLEYRDILEGSLCLARVYAPFYQFIRFNLFVDDLKRNKIASQDDSDAEVFLKVDEDLSISHFR